MKNLPRCLVLSVFLIGACAVTPANQPALTEDKTVPEPSLEMIAAGVWVHKSHKNIPPWGPILSQGLVVKSDGIVTLIDTAWNDADTDKLLDLIETEIGEAPMRAILTHAHADKMGGVGALHRRNIRTRAHRYSNEDAAARNLTPALVTLLSEETNGRAILSPAAGHKLSVFYPGPGHTRDNIVVYYAPAKVLFGGCLIRPGDAKSLGNTADADIANWADAVRKVAAEFPDAEIIIPSHGAPGGRELLDLTIALAEAAASN